MPTIFHIYAQWFRNLGLQNQFQRSHSQEWTQCMISLIGLPIFSGQPLSQLTQDHKGLSKACNGDECKGMVI